MSVFEGYVRTGTEKAEYKPMTLSSAVEAFRKFPWKENLPDESGEVDGGFMEIVAFKREDGSHIGIQVDHDGTFFIKIETHRPRKRLGFIPGRESLCAFEGGMNERDVEKSIEKLMTLTVDQLFEWLQTGTPGLSQPLQL